METIFMITRERYSAKNGKQWRSQQVGAFSKYESCVTFLLDNGFKEYIFYDEYHEYWSTDYIRVGGLNVEYASIVEYYVD